MDGPSADSKPSANTLSFGPTWLKQFANPDGQRNHEPDGLTFQMAKHRYGREEILAIYNAIEKKLLSKSMPKELADFEGFFQKELQKPILLSAPTTEEQKLMSSCVNSQAALNAFNKAKGAPSAGNRSSEGKKNSRDAKASSNKGSTQSGTRGRDKEQKTKKNPKEWRNNKEGSGSKKTNDDSFKNRANDTKESQPEWFNDEEIEKKELNESKTMTFDENGKFIIQDEYDKDSNGKTEASNDSMGSKSVRDPEEREYGSLASKMTDILINETEDNPEINELNQQFRQAQAQLMVNRLQSADFSVNDKWFYLDSHSKTQGPFSSEQMANWLASGYFSMNLMVKRGCDDKFVPLGLIVQNLNQMRVQQNSGSFKTPSSQTQSHNLPQNFSKPSSEFNDSNLSHIIQQLQQIQVQQKAAVASLNTLGVNAVASILQELRNKQENLISQINITKQNSPIINNILQQSLNLNPGWVGQGSGSLSSHQLGAAANPLKEKILALMEIKRKEEEKRRMIEEEIRLKQEEEKRRLMEEARIKQLIIMSKLARQQNLNINQNLPNYLEQQALEKKMLMEQIKLKEMLNAQQNGMNNAMGYYSGQQFSSFSNDQSFTDLLRKENEFQNDQGKQNSVKFSDDIAALSAKKGFFVPKNDQIIES
ncbi:PERQ amino acid-rich with GYF domain-containing 1 isoform X1 [Brachionus plicatilis]|uniref:PERQ amino acid-rich with GYF domain-containing 1 isoform X1 n=1 Tax=Brachionus plicatilis TaxID=10195 RepID=A0A3M7SZN6_BRAPC|nr:PERQ amino acid-rich with GYF domain-containing 1 isoform X1 [Brachionus plicatilis]